MPKVSLHPSVRQRNDPRLSTNQLAEYVVFGIERAEGIIHDAKFLQPYIPSWYDDSSAALVGYLTNPLRDKSVLYAEIERLGKIVKTAESADKRDRAALDIRVLEKFLLAENSMGLSKLGFISSPKCQPLKMETVSISVQPDLLVQPLIVANQKKVGAVIFRLSKGIDPESAARKETREKRKELRREMGRYVAVMGSMLLEKQFAHLGPVSAEHCLAIDVPLGEAIPLPGNRTTRVATLKKACRQIAQVWPNVEPKPGICL